MKNYTQYAKEVFQIEAKALADLGKQLDDNFNKAVDTVLKSKGRLVVCGVGKSGLVGAKISATLASTGTPSMFMHPVEAFHGDLGMLKKEDVLVAISYSGETEELLKLVPYIKAAQIKIIGMSGNPNSTLAKNSDYHLNVKVYKEACPLELAPTSSTTATIAMGDALAVALMKARDFKPEDFAKFHPGGSLGRKLLTTVESCMFKDKLPVVKPADTMQHVINTMSSGRLGLAVVTDKKKIMGIITDGDLRRMLEKNKSIETVIAADIMSSNPKHIEPDALAVDALDQMRKHEITQLVVCEEGKYKGIIHLQDLIKEGLI